MSTQKTSGKTLLGIFDTISQPRTLGDTLTFAEELLAKGDEGDYPTPDVRVLISTQQTADADFGKDRFAPADVLDAVEGIGSVTTASSLADLTRQMTLYTCETWPELHGDTLTRPTYTGTLFLQKHYARRGRIPILRMKHPFIKKAHQFIGKHAGDKTAVAVHLKNNPADTRSNADFGVWFEFIRTAAGQGDFSFFLIGNEEIDEGITRMPNVTVTHDCGYGLIDDLALVGAADLFLGMSSGPCNAAIFGRSPYAIFKDPDHHAAEMKREIGDADRFPFAFPGQHFFRMKPSSRDIAEILSCIITESKLIRQKQTGGMAHAIPHD